MSSTILRMWNWRVAVVFQLRRIWRRSAGNRISGGGFEQHAEEAPVRRGTVPIVAGEFPNDGERSLVVFRRCSGGFGIAYADVLGGHARFRWMGSYCVVSGVGPDSMSRVGGASPLLLSWIDRWRKRACVLPAKTCPPGGFNSPPRPLNLAESRPALYLYRIAPSNSEEFDTDGWKPLLSL